MGLKNSSKEPDRRMENSALPTVPLKELKKKWSYGMVLLTSGLRKFTKLERWQNRAMGAKLETLRGREWE